MFLCMCLGSVHRNYGSNVTSSLSLCHSQLYSQFTFIFIVIIINAAHMMIYSIDFHIYMRCTTPECHFHLSTLNSTLVCLSFRRRHRRRRWIHIKSNRSKLIIFAFSLYYTHTFVRWCYSSERFLTHINYAKTPTFCAEQFTLSLFKKQSRSPFINIADVFIYLFGFIEKFLSQFFRLSFALDKRHTALHKMKHIRKQCGHPQIKYNTILLHTVIRPESKNKILGASESTEILFSLRMKCSET